MCIRDSPGADYAYIELVFSVTGEEKRKALRELDVEPTEDGLVDVYKRQIWARWTAIISRPSARC